MTELTTGALREALARVAEAGVARAALALEGLAVAVEEQAKRNASNGSHGYGTPTPASPGEGPAQISGTLVASIGHTLVEKAPEGWATKVGPRAGYTPPYNSRTPASRYGFYLETGLRNGSTYPFLGPAAESVGESEAALLFARSFSAGWAGGA